MWFDKISTSEKVAVTSIQTKTLLLFTCNAVKSTQMLHIYK